MLNPWGILPFALQICQERRFLGLYWPGCWYSCACLWSFHEMPYYSTWSQFRQHDWHLTLRWALWGMNWYRLVTPLLSMVDYPEALSLLTMTNTHNQGSVDKTVRSWQHLMDSLETGFISMKAPETHRNQCQDGKNPWRDRFNNYVCSLAINLRSESSGKY